MVERLFQHPARGTDPRDGEGLAMDLELTGKVAIVTGGSRGIGKAIARELALEGVDVAVCARSPGPLEKAAQELAEETGRRILPIELEVDSLMIPLNADTLEDFDIIEVYGIARFTGLVLRDRARQWCHSHLAQSPGLCRSIPGRAQRSIAAHRHHGPLPFGHDPHGRGKSCGPLRGRKLAFVFLAECPLLARNGPDSP